MRVLKKNLTRLVRRAHFFFFSLQSYFCRPQTAFSPLIKVSPQFLIKGIALSFQFPIIGCMPLLKSLVPRACKRACLLKGKEKRVPRGRKRERVAPKAKEGSLKNYKFLLSPKWPSSRITLHYLILFLVQRFTFHFWKHF